MPKVNVNYLISPEDVEEFYDGQERRRIMETGISRISGGEWMLTDRYQARRRHKRERTAYKMRHRKNGIR